MRVIGAIDIGSNAMRCAVGTVEKNKLKVLGSERHTVSLGRTVFANRERKIDRQTLFNAKQTFKSFAAFFDQHHAETFRAVGTSALRDATNGEELIEIASTFGIRLEIISGQEEARLIHQAVAHVIDLSKGTAGLFDIGGGSAEFTLLKEGKTLFSVSERVGTIRLLRAVAEQRVGMDRFIERVKRIIHSLALQVEHKLKEETLDILVGTGGNLEELGKLRTKVIVGKKKSDKIKINELEYIITLLEHLTLDERQEQFGFRADRADVILPAAIVLREIMERARSQVVRIPGVGLKEGVLVDQFIELGEIA